MPTSNWLKNRTKSLIAVRIGPILTAVSGSASSDGLLTDLGVNINEAIRYPLCHVKDMATVARSYVALASLEF